MDGFGVARVKLSIWEEGAQKEEQKQPDGNNFRGGVHGQYIGILQ